MLILSFKDLNSLENNTHYLNKNVNYLKRKAKEMNAFQDDFQPFLKQAKDVQNSTLFELDRLLFRSNKFAITFTDFKKSTDLFDDFYEDLDNFSSKTSLIILSLNKLKNIFFLNLKSTVITLDDITNEDIDSLYERFDLFSKNLPDEKVLNYELEDHQQKISRYKEIIAKIEAEINVITRQLDVLNSIDTVFDARMCKKASKNSNEKIITDE